MTQKTQTVKIYRLDVTTPSGSTLAMGAMGEGTKAELKRRFAGIGGKGCLLKRVPGYTARLVPIGTREVFTLGREPKLKAKKGAKFSVNTYERAQHYGGCEEGGWWYHIQGIVENRQFRNLNKAKAYLAKLRARIVPISEEDTCLVSRRERVSDWANGFSVLDGYGQGEVVELEPHALPAREELGRPRYE